MSFSDIIALWPDITSFAADIGCELDAARKWRARDSIPAAYWGELVKSAASRGFSGVTLEALSALAARSRGNAA